MRAIERGERPRVPHGRPLSARSHHTCRTPIRATTADQHHVRHHEPLVGGPRDKLTRKLAIRTGPCAISRSGLRTIRREMRRRADTRINADRTRASSDPSLVGQLRDFLKYLSLNRNASPHTVRGYDADLRQFVAFLADERGRQPTSLGPLDLDVDAVRGYLAMLYRARRSRASAARKLAALRAFGRYLRREDMTDAEPAALVSAPKRVQTIPAHLSEDEMGRLLEMPDAGSPLGRRDRAILELFYASGLRLSELVGLDLDDVNLSRRMVRVLGKGRKERLVPFNTSAESAIRATCATGNRSWREPRTIVCARLAAHNLATPGMGHRCL